MTDAPERIWAVYYEGDSSMDIMPEVFADEERFTLRNYERCYGTEAQEYVRADLYEALERELENTRDFDRMREDFRNYLKDKE